MEEPYRVWLAQKAFHGVPRLFGGVYVGDSSTIVKGEVEGGKWRRWRPMDLGIDKGLQDWTLVQDRDENLNRGDRSHTPAGSFRRS